MSCRNAVYALVACTALPVFAEFTIDRSVMSDEYWKLWNDVVQKRIDVGIEQHRKANAEVEVPAKDGTKVRVEQISHDFLFGAQFFFFNQLGRKDWNDKYKAVFGSLFNGATVAFFWRTLEPYPRAVRFEEHYEDTEGFWNDCKNPKEQPHWRRPPPDPVISYLKARGCRIHGHPLVWSLRDYHMPSWLWDDMCPEEEKFALQQASGVRIPRGWDSKVPMGTREVRRHRDWCLAWRTVYKRLSEEKIASLVPTYIKAIGEYHERRIRMIAERYGNLVDSWDAVNESASDFQSFGCKAVRRRPFDKAECGPMPADYAYQAFAWCMKYLPAKAKLNLNDYNMKPFLLQVKELEANGARIDTIGTQMHIWGDDASAAIAAGKGSADFTPEGLDRRFNMLAKANRPILMSETTISASERTPQGEMVQAVIARNLYRYWFSVENLAGITWWNLVDDCGPAGEPTNSGIFTREMRPKAVYFMLDDLINREWKTDMAVEAKNGKVTFRGFRGRYRLSWKDKSGRNTSKLVVVK